MTPEQLLDELMATVKAAMLEYINYELSDDELMATIRQAKEAYEAKYNAHWSK